MFEDRISECVIFFNKQGASFFGPQLGKKSFTARFCALNYKGSGVGKYPEFVLPVIDILAGEGIGRGFDKIFL